MLLTRTLRSPCGLVVARVSLEDTWAEYLVSVYVEGKSVSAHYHETEEQAIAHAQEVVLQKVTPSPHSSVTMGELSLVPML